MGLILHIKQILTLVDKIYRTVFQVFGIFPGTETEVLGRQAAEDWV